MEKELSNPNELYLFKGQFIESFIHLEKELETFIVEVLKSKVAFIKMTDELRDIFHQNNNLNKTIEEYWRHFIFENVDIGFMFKQKFGSYKFLLVQSHKTLYKILEANNKESVLELISKLQTVRNTIAHNSLLVERGQSDIFSLKNKTEIKRQESEYHKILNTDRYFYTNKLSPKKYIFNSKVCSEMLEQLKLAATLIACTNSFLDIKSHYFHKQLDKEKEVLEYIDKYMADIAKYEKKGVYEFFNIVKKTNQREEQEAHKLKKAARATTSKKTER